ncbi:recombinase family protein [Streptomyces brasiliensis]|uniref:Resolvase/invertase-type recombinase catalytic domain-containing protein n=1 Tax=Streptomyces brasiliensis TaxID=1954 RepID=A0A917UNP9_9ACTN|nr:recombinase family protein [Streptomyces brasiliensis]GGJ70893.1 hypothetical protein GCM10010121_096890 [Streptomyces brasiliensis]
MEAGTGYGRRARATRLEAHPIGYARTSTARQELVSQLEALHAADRHKVFSEQISTRIKVRPELEKALALARQFRDGPGHAGHLHRP